MAIHLNIKIEDKEVEDLLSFMRGRFSDSWTSDHIDIMERAIKLLRFADDYVFKTDPLALNAILLQNDDASPLPLLPTDEHFQHPSPS